MERRVKKVKPIARKKKKGGPPAEATGKDYLYLWVSQHKSLAKDADRYADLLRLSLLDSGFRRRLVDNPGVVLKEFGITPPKGLKVEVVDNNGDTLHLMIPRLAAVVKSSCAGSLKDWELKSPDEKKYCIDDFNRGNGGFGDQRDSGDPHTVD